MKSNFFKYVFVIFVIGIMIFAIYKIKTEEKNNNNQQAQVNIEQKKSTEIKLGVASFDSTNPIFSKNKNIQDISKLIYEPLFSLSVDYKLEPCLAKDFAKQDSKTYIIQLKDNIRWSDGEKFTVEDVKFTVEKIKQTDSIYAPNVKNITEIQIIDDYTFKIILDEEVPFFEYNLIFPIMSNQFYMDKEFTSGIVPVGTGMFKYIDVKSTHLTMARNNNWWDNKNNISLNNIYVNIYSSLGELYNSFKMGNLDLISTDNINIEEYIGTIGYSKKEMKGRKHDFLGINMSNHLLSKKEVRKAIAFSIDKSNIISSVFNNKYYTSDFPLDYGNWLYKEEKVSSGFNPEQANKILKENGWNLKGGVWQKIENYKPLNLTFNLAVKSSDHFQVEVAKNIQSQLAQQGIRININQLSDDNYIETLNNKKYDLILCGLNLGMSPNLSTFFGENNISNYNNEEITKILEEVNNTKDDNILVERYKKIAEIYKDDVPYISLYNNKYIVAYSTGLIGNVTPNWYNDFYNISTWYK